MTRNLPDGGYPLSAMILSLFPVAEWEHRFISASSRCNVHIYSLARATLLLQFLNCCNS
jgi:hypothetical protein